MDPDLLHILHGASNSLQRGTPPETVDLNIRRMTGLAGMTELKLAVSAQGQSGQAEARDLAEVADRGPLVNTAGGVVHGASFGLVDELLNSLGMNQAGAAMKSGIEQNRQYAPGASMASEMGGALAGPGVAMLAPLKAGSTAARVGLMGATGAAEGALFGFGEAEGPMSERARAAVGPAVLGGAAAGTLGVGGEVLRRVGPPIKRMFGQRAPRVAGEMMERADLGPGINPVKADIDRQLTEVQETYFKPLDAQFEEVTDLPIMEFFRRMAEDPTTRGQMRSVLPSEIVETFRAGLDDAASAPIPKFSFSNVQALRTRLRGDRAGRFDAEASELSGLMDEAFGENFRVGNREYARVQRRADAVSLGERTDQNFGFGPYAEKLGPVNTAERLQHALQQMPPEVHQDFLTAHMHTNYIVPLNRGGASKLQELFRVIPEGGAPEIEAALRAYFPDDAAYQEFRQVLKTERSAQRIASAFKKLAPIALIGTAGYAGYRAGQAGGEAFGFFDAIN